MRAALRGRRLRQVLTAKDFITIIIVTLGKIFRMRQAVLVSFWVPTPGLMRYDLGGRDGRWLRPGSELKKCEHERC
jgi:hypothetical protein